MCVAAMDMAFTPNVKVLGRYETVLVAVPVVTNGLLPRAAMKLG